MCHPKVPSNFFVVACVDIVQKIKDIDKLRNDGSSKELVRAEW